MLKVNVVLLAASVIALTLGGCESGQTTVSLDDAVRHYDAQRYSLARQEAQQVRRSASGAERASADYLAGIAAYQLGDADDARADLMAAAASTESEISGRAAAQLGIIELEFNHPTTAARHFETAAAKLSGTAARQASQHAAMAHQMAGDYSTAQQWLARSESYQPTATLASVSLTDSRFVLQAGAFESRSRAERTAADLERLASTHHLGPVRVVRGPTSRGRELHMVQFGAFSSRSDASRARANLGRLEVIVVPSR